MKFAFLLPLTISGMSIQQRILKEVDDLLITVKSTRKNHNTRVQLILDSWHPKSLEKTYIITDSNDGQLRSKMKSGHVISTHCQADHSR